MPEYMKTNSWSTAGQAKDISSSPNPLVKVLRRDHHWVWGSNRRRAVKEWSIAINNDWVDNWACSLPHNIQAIANSFITVNKSSELLRKVNFLSWTKLSNLTQNLVGSIGATGRSKMTKIFPIWNPRCRLLRSSWKCILNCLSRADRL